MELQKMRRKENLFLKIKYEIKIDITINFLYKLAVNQPSVCIKTIEGCSF